MTLPLLPRMRRYLVCALQSFVTSLDFTSPRYIQCDVQYCLTYLRAVLLPFACLACMRSANRSDGKCGKCRNESRESTAAAVYRATITSRQLRHVCSVILFDCERLVSREGLSIDYFIVLALIHGKLSSYGSLRELSVCRCVDSLKVSVGPETC